MCHYSLSANAIASMQNLVCNYGIGGNMMGDKVYTVGETASACPNGSNDGICL